jgi:hypothetical protein
MLEVRRKVVDQPAREADQDRRQGRQPRSLRHVPDGRGRGAAADVCGNLVAHRPATGAAKSSRVICHFLSELKRRRVPLLRCCGATTVPRIEWPPLRISVEDFSKTQPNDTISPTIRQGSILPNGFRRLGVTLHRRSLGPGSRAPDGRRCRRRWGAGWIAGRGPQTTNARSRRSHQFTQTTTASPNLMPT